MKNFLFTLVLLIALPLWTQAATLNTSQTSIAGNGLIGLWTFDGKDMNWAANQALDRSGFGVNGQLNGGFSTTTSPSSGKVGQGLYFIAGNYIDVGTSDNPTTNNFTIAFWERSNINGGGRPYWTFISNRQNNAAFSGFLVTQDFTGATGKLRIQLNDQTNFHQYNGATNVSDGRWHYIVISVSRSTNLMSIYVDGAVDVANVDISAVSGSIASTNAIQIAQDQAFCSTDTLACHFQGNMDDVRFYNRALSLAEAQALYRNGFAKTNTSWSFITNGLVSDWTFNGPDMSWATGQALDRIGGNNGSLSNLSTTTSAVAGKLGQALKFNGTNAVVTVPNSGTLNAGSGDFSVSVWYYNGKNMTANDNILSKGSAFNAGATGFALRSRNNGASVEFCVNGGSGTCPRITKPTLINSWNHAVVVVSRTNNLSTLYINGVQAGTMAWAPTYTDTFGLTIGQGENGFFPDKIDDVRFYNRALSASEVAQLYGYGAATMNISANTRSASGLIGLWSFDGKDMSWAANQALDRSGNGNNGTLFVLGTTTAPVPGKIGQALHFNGISSYIDAANSTSLDVNTGGSVTMCAWVYNDVGSVSAFQGLMAKRNDSLGTPYAYGMNFHTNLFQVYTSGASGIKSFVYNIPAKQWTHICGVISATSATALYVNGSLFGTSGTGGGVASNTATFAIGNSGDAHIEFFQGKIDDVRLYNRALSAAEVAQLYNQGR